MTQTLYADLHTHTTASDGTFTPTELVQAAKAAGLTYLAVTDHDTTAGVAEAQRVGQELGVKIIPGVELSAEGAPGKCHLLGLGIDPAYAPMTDTLRTLSEARRARNEKMAARLRSLGVAITLEEVTIAAPPGANVGRPHFAQVLIDKGFVPDKQTAFDRYLGDSAAGYVEKETLSPAEAITLIHDAGGMCFIAHPGLLKLYSHETDETRMRALKALGMDGLEAYYSAYSPVQSERFIRLAQKLDLLVTGGSDFHGANKPDVPLSIVRDGSPLAADLLPPALLAYAR
jgi:predicted metal-dependent phosphoesterase TrpH